LAARRVVVAGRVDLNHVAADDLEALHGLLRLATREASDLSGAPTMAAFGKPFVFGRRMKVRTPEKRGVSNESAGQAVLIRSVERTPCPAP
jgi:hypothetical protein